MKTEPDPAQRRTVLPDIDIDPETVAKLAAELCHIPSPSGAEGPLAEFIAEYLGPTGADIHLQEVVPGRPNLIARAGRRGGQQLVLVGHLDSSAAPGWTRDPYEPLRSGDRLEGAGLSDMKGGLAAMLVAFEASCRLELDGELVLIAAMGHSPLGLGTKYALLTEGPWQGVAVFGQSSGLRVHTANGGSIKFEIVVTGRAAHIAKATEAIDALRGARAIANALDRRSLTYQANERLPDLPRLVIGEFSAGSSVARFPGTAVIRGDVRTVPGMTRQTVTVDLRAAIEASRLDPRLSISCRVTHVQVPFLGDTRGTLVRLLGTAHEAALGRPLEPTAGMPTEAFITDASDLAAAGLDTVMYGPAEWRNEPGEWVSIAELRDAAQVYLALVWLVCGVDGVATSGT